MSQVRTWEGMSPEILWVAERAYRDPDGQFHSLAHLLDVPALRSSFYRLRRRAAVGVDGTTKDRYEEKLQDHLEDLLVRLKTKRYRHQPIRRTYLPKANGGKRPLGISVIEDKIVQDALREVLQAVFEQDFLDCSYGFRPGRGAHDAIRALNQAAEQGVANWILEADIVSFFDSVDRDQLLEMLQKRVSDGSLLRLVRKCLHAGILEEGVIITPETGTAQGSILSPLLGNIYLHYVLDQWFYKEVQPRLRGRACLIRYADDFVITLADQRDAERVWAVLPKRFERYGLALHPDKTRLLDYRRPSVAQQTGKGPATFDFLGFTHYWRRTHWGRWRTGCQTIRSRLRRAMKAVTDLCRSRRHLDVETQQRALCIRLQGHYNYFGVNGNLESLSCLYHHAVCVWLKWLSRRSQRARLNWQHYQHLLKNWPLPPPRIRVQIWGWVR